MKGKRQSYKRLYESEHGAVMQLQKALYEKSMVQAAKDRGAIDEELVVAAMLERLVNANNPDWKLEAVVALRLAVEVLEERYKRDLEEDRKMMERVRKIGERIAADRKKEKGGVGI